MAGGMRPAFDSVWRAPARQGPCLQVPGRRAGPGVIRRHLCGARGCRGSEPADRHHQDRQPASTEHALSHKIIKPVPRDSAVDSTEPVTQFMSLESGSSSSVWAMIWVRNLLACRSSSGSVCQHQNSRLSREAAVPLAPPRVPRGAHRACGLDRLRSARVR
jgi:hypothetical protein